MAADFPEAAAGSPEGVVVEVFIQKTGTEAEADVSPAAVFREEAIVVVITVVETAAAVSNAETAAAATLPETAAVATLPETTAAAEKAATPPPALDPTGPCNNACRRRRRRQRYNAKEPQTKERGKRKRERDKRI